MDSCCFENNFRFSNYCHIHHKGIVACHVVVMAELVNRILLMDGALEFFICWCECFLNSGWPHKRHIKAIELTTSEWVDSLLLDWSSSYSCILAFLLSIFALDQDMLWSLRGSCGWLSLDVIRLSLNICFSWSSFSISWLAKFGSMGHYFVHPGGCTLLHEVDRCIGGFCLIWLGQVLFVHHHPSYL